MLMAREILDGHRLRLEDVASGYWTLPFKQSSGQVSHYGSSPSSSARLLDLRWFAIIVLLKGSVPTGNLPSPA
jgi:hypothetical protein